MDIHIGGLSIWILTRATGIAGYLLLSASVIIGLALAQQREKGKPNATLMLLHAPVSLWAILLGMFHAAILLYDKYIGFTWYELVVPFLAEYHRVAVGMGILSLYGILAVALTTEWRRRLGEKRWRFIHQLSYLFYVMVTFHGIFTGTSTQSFWMQALYSISVFTVSLMLIKRFPLEPVTKSVVSERKT